MPGGIVGHAEIRIGNSVVMMADENPEWGNKSPLTTGGPTCGFLIYVEDCDAAFAKAIAAGCSEKRPVEDQFYGDRTGTVICPFGHQWSIGTHIKDMTADEMQVAMDEMMKAMS
jgi:PhnB protein